MTKVNFVEIKKKASQKAQKVLQQVLRQRGLPTEGCSVYLTVGHEYNFQFGYRIPRKIAESVAKEVLKKIQAQK